MKSLKRAFGSDLFIIPFPSLRSSLCWASEPIFTATKIPFDIFPRGHYNILKSCLRIYPNGINGQALRDLKKLVS